MSASLSFLLGLSLASLPLRVADGDLPKLGAAVISDLYAMPPDADLHLIPQGFIWP